VHLGHFLPDYTAYEELLDIFRRFTPIPILLDPERRYAFSADDLAARDSGAGPRRAAALEPLQPDGQARRGSELALGGHRPRATTARCSSTSSTPTTSGAPRRDRERRGPRRRRRRGSSGDLRRPHQELALPRLARLPGPSAPSPSSRPSRSAGSFLDGGGARPLQRAAVDLLAPEVADQEAQAIRAAYRDKRSLLLGGLRRLGVRFDLEPEGTFYGWGDLSGLPEPLADGQRFFQAALEHRIICVPGAFFDVDPGQRRGGRPSRFQKHVRFSFGPATDVLEEALGRLEKLIADPPAS
jgi:hypothetical protein